MCLKFSFVHRTVSLWRPSPVWDRGPCWERRLPAASHGGGGSRWTSSAGRGRPGHNQVVLMDESSPFLFCFFLLSISAPHRAPTPSCAGASVTSQEEQEPAARQRSAGFPPKPPALAVQHREAASPLPEVHRGDVPGVSPWPACPSRSRDHPKGAAPHRATPPCPTPRHAAPPQESRKKDTFVLFFFPQDESPGSLITGKET